MRTPDAQLIAEYLEGDDKALATLVDRHLKGAYNFAFTLTRDAQAADDIAQESFVKAWKHIRRFRTGSSFRTWLFAIVRNTAIDWLRRKREVTFSSFETVDGENPLLETLSDTEPRPDELLARAEDATFVKELLGRIDSRYRDVLELRYESNLTFEEIGKILKRPLHTVKSQHRRALIALRRLSAEVKAI